jgi:hypothetical protein
MPAIRELQGDPATEKYLDEDQVGVSQTKLGFPNVTHPLFDS